VVAGGRAEDQEVVVDGLQDHVKLFAESGDVFSM
jgi:hypothetical protein